MEYALASLLAFGLVVGGILFIKVQMPSRVPKRSVLDPMIAASDMIFNIRMSIYSVISETMSLYSPGYNQANIQDRQGSITRQLTEIRRQLALSEDRYKTYAGARSEKGFYDLCVSAKETLSQVVDTLESFGSDFALIQDIMLQMRQLHAETGSPILNQYVDENEPRGRAVHEAGAQIEKIINIAHKLVESTKEKQYIFAESQQVGLSITELVNEFAGEYMRLKDVLTRDIPAFRMASMTVPMLSSQYNSSSYEATLRSIVERTPEAPLVEEIRRVSYQV